MNDTDFDPDAEFDADVEPVPGSQIDAVSDDEVVEPLFPDVYTFVSDFLSHIYPAVAHRQREVNWNSKWWSYEHAVIRLEALWQRFEQLRRDEPATYLETFLRVHADYHMNQLMAEQGVFADTKRQDFPAHPLECASPYVGEIDDAHLG
ncbi:MULTISPECIES: DUF4913 domain-containing protein [Corynebacterium]|uniref:DUF4913 domain-containing protein n=1 Tax=Corynebacterium TaxID=1716 RepID=UPI00124C75AE|nr:MULTISPECIES: DUF4913 domain-containing protein [Corynebacterium]